MSGESSLPQKAELSAVPFYPQEEYQCGPAALAMVLEAAGKPVTPEDLRAQVYIPDRQGSLQIEMLAAARRNGYVAVELRSGTEMRLEMPLSTFERTWQRAGYWAMLALPPGRFPATTTPAEYLSAVTRLEKAGPPEAARSAYQRALERWPDQFTALMGAGNTAYRAGDFEGAERAFRRATVMYPRSAAAHNNLAQTLADLDRYDEAISEARLAVGLGGPLENTSIRTLDTIVKRTGRGEQEWNK